MTRLGRLDLSEAPCVVGSVITWDGLQDLVSAGAAPCEIVEIRLDRIGAAREGGAAACRALQDAGLTQILTLRHEAEGGAWRETDRPRVQWLAPVLGFVDAVDVEIGQPDAREVIDAVHGAGGCLIGSFHDFDTTPSFEELSHIVRNGLAMDVDVVKIATRTETETEVATLERLLRACADISLAVLGMGTRGPDTRISLPAQGSCLSYGYLDTAAAPVQ